MKLSLNLLTALLAISITSSVSAKDAIKDLFESNLPNSSIGFAAIDAVSGELRYQLDANKLMRPASTQKLLTAIVALDELGEEFSFTTTLYGDKHLKPGSVAIKFTGDPSFNSNNLANLLDYLIVHRSHKLNGNVIIDGTAFTGAVHARGWPQNDLRWYFATPVSPMVINENYIPIVIQAGKLGSKTKILLGQGANYQVVGSPDTVTYLASRQDCSLEIANKRDKILAAGCWPVTIPKLHAKLAINETEFYIEQKIKKMLSAKAINYKRLKFKKVQNDMLVLKQHKSPPLKFLLKQVLQDSNNLYSECIFRALGNTDNNPSFKGGAKVLKAKLGFNHASYIIEDGSGLSLNNLVSPMLLAKAFYMGLHSQHKQVLLNNMTRIQDKLKLGLHVKGVLKTGYMTDCYNIICYLEDKNISLIAAIMINNTLADRHILEETLKKALKLLLNNK